MGVVNLWKILHSTCKPVTLSDLKNKTLAIDLSIWICENSNIAYNSQTNQKPYLRTLFFRTKSLIEMGCKLIFVREGDVIELKQETMKKRNHMRFGGSGEPPTISSSQMASQKPIAKRNRHDSVVDECCEMLKNMGLKVIRSPCGEAEKACAFLNLIGRCDGVITEDSDVLLYGARVVYRNFGTDIKSEIEEYSMERIEQELEYDREMLVVLGLLLGCDYADKGIPGVGKELACKFLNEIIQINKNSRKTIDFFDMMRKWTRDNYVGCGSKSEDRIRKMAISYVNSSENKQFPNEEIIKEYMNFSRRAQIILSEEKYTNIKWKRPNLSGSQVFNNKYQNWSNEYTADKLVPLIILYESKYLKLAERTIKPLRINKIRRRNFNEYYEVIWSKMIISADSTSSTSTTDKDLSELNEYVTLENKEFIEENYPTIYADFKNQIENKKTNRKNKKKTLQVKDVNGDDEYDGMESLMELYETDQQPNLPTQSDNKLVSLNENSKEEKRKTTNNDDDDDGVELIELIMASSSSSLSSQVTTRTKQKNKNKDSTTSNGTTDVPTKQKEENLISAKNKTRPKKDSNKSKKNPKDNSDSNKIYRLANILEMSDDEETDNQVLSQFRFQSQSQFKSQSQSQSQPQSQFQSQFRYAERVDTINGFSQSKKMEIIVLDSEESDDEIKLVSNKSIKNKNDDLNNGGGGDDLDLLLQSFQNVKIDSAADKHLTNKKFNEICPEIEIENKENDKSVMEISYLPLSMRMKKIYQASSLLNK